MAKLHELPVEMLTGIASYLYVPDLVNFAKARLVLYQACKKRLTEHVKLHKLATQAKRTRSMDYARGDDWLQLFFTVLKTPNVALYIDCLYTAQPATNDVLREEFKRTAEDKLALVRGVLDGSTWIRPDSAHYASTQRLLDPEGPYAIRRMIQCLASGGINQEWTLLPLLLPLLVNIRTLELGPFGGSWNQRHIQQFFDEVAEKRHLNPSNHPFPSLTTIKLTGYFLAETVKSMLRLPTIKNASITGTMPLGRPVNWDLSPLKSNVQELKLAIRCMEQESAELYNNDLASAITGPCRITNSWFKVRNPAFEAWNVVRHHYVTETFISEPDPADPLEIYSTKIVWTVTKHERTDYTEP